MCLIVYLKKKEFCSYFPSSFSIYFWQEPFAWRYWQSCQSLLQPFWHGSPASNATHQWPPRVNAGRSWSSPSSKGFDIWPSNFHSPLSGQIISPLLFSPFCLDEHLFSFDSSQLPQICCQLGALAITVTQITLSFSSISRLKYLGPIKMNVLFSRRYTVTNNLPKMDHCTQIGGISLITCLQSCTYEMLTCCGTVNTAE